MPNSRRRRRGGAEAPSAAPAVADVSAAGDGEPSPSRGRDSTRDAAWGDSAVVVRVTEPATPGPLSNPEIFHGPPITPLQRITLYSDEEFEAFVQEWAYGSVRRRYGHVAWAPGSGDRGRDVIGYETEDLSRSPFDVYQCKRYDHRLAPSEMWVEFGKVCVYTHRGVYRMPRSYRFVASQGIGPSLLALFEEPEAIRQKLIAEWPDKCARSISSREEIPLVDELLAHVETFNFSIFGYVEPLALVEDLRDTSYYPRRFGGGLRPRPRPPDPPTAVEQRESRYVEHLLDAYGDHRRREFASVDDLDGDAQLREHFIRQRQAFYRAEALREFERDTTADDSGFRDLKEEIYNGVVDTCCTPHSSGYERVVAVTGEARRLQLTSYALVSAMHVEDRAGICHHLANDDRLIWVPR